MQAACVTSEAVDIFCRKQGVKPAYAKENLQKRDIAIVDAPVADWCMLRNVANSQLPFVRKPQLRPVFAI